MERDKFLNQIISKKEVPFIPSGLENKIMSEIGQIAANNEVNKRPFNLAWLFFIIGAILGFFLSTFILHSDLEIYGIKINQLRIPVLVIITGILLLIFDRLIRTFINKDYLT